MSQAPVALGSLPGLASLPGSRLEPAVSSRSPVAQCVQTKQRLVSCMGGE